MPKTTPKEEAKPASFDRSNKPSFVRCELNKEQRALLVEWAESLEDMDLLKWIEHEVMRGHTLSVRANPVGYQCSLTGVTESSGHVGISLVARASTAIRAMQGCMYRDQMVLTDGWPVTDLVNDLDF